MNVFITQSIRIFHYLWVETLANGFINNLIYFFHVFLLQSLLIFLVVVLTQLIIFSFLILCLLSMIIFCPKRLFINFLMPIWSILSFLGMISFTFYIFIVSFLSLLSLIFVTTIVSNPPTISTTAIAPFLFIRPPRLLLFFSCLPVSLCQCYFYISTSLMICLLFYSLCVYRTFHRWYFTFFIRILILTSYTFRILFLCSFCLKEFECKVLKDLLIPWFS